MPSKRTLGPGGKFTPKSVRGLALWLDAADPQSLYTTAAGPVTVPPGFEPQYIASAHCVGHWDASAVFSMQFDFSSGNISGVDDLTGHEHHATQVTPASRPRLIPNALNGLPVIRFNGLTGLAGNFNNYNVAAPARTVVVVCRTTLYSNNGRVFSAAPPAPTSDFAAGGWIPCLTNAGSLTSLSSYTTAGNASPVDGFDRFQVFVGRSTGTSVINRSGGASGVSASYTITQSATRFGIGCAAMDQSAKFVGDIAEVLFFEGYASDADVALIEKHLSVKWGLSGIHSPASLETSAVDSPLELHGCVGWYDSADLSAMKQNSNGTGSVAAGNPVGYWQDKSAAGNHLTAPTDAKRPVLTASSLNGRTSLVFDGVDDTLLRNPYSSQSGLVGLTRIAVCAQTQIGALAGLSRDTSGGGFFLLLNGGGRFFTDNSTSFITSSPVLYSNSILPATILATVFTPSSLTLSDGGVSQAVAVQGTVPSITSSVSGQLSVGSNDNANYFWKGPIAEYIIFNRALTQNELDRVEKYLAAKWGIANVPDPTPPVGAWLDKSGNARHATQSAAGNRPRIQSSLINNKRVVEFPNNAADQQNQLNISGALTTTNNIEMIVVTRKIGLFGGSGGYGALLRSSTAASQGPWLAIDLGRIVMYGGTQGSQLSASAVPASAFIAHGSMIDGSTELRINGALVDSDSLTGTPAVAATSGTRIGPYYNNGGGPLYADVAEVLAYNKVLTPPERRRIERYLAARWGITLAPTVSNADAQGWINRVYANGGTVSAATAGAVNEFCNTIDRAGNLRTAFYRLNLFCGNSDANLIAVRTPLYLSPNRTSANLFQHGNDLTNTVWQGGGGGIFTKTLVTSPSASELTPFQTIPTKLTTANSNPQFQIWQSPSVYGTTVTMSVWLKANTGTVEMGWMKGGAVATDIFTVTTSWANYATTFTLPAFSGQADIRTGLYSVTPLNGEQHVLAYGMSLTLGTALGHYTQPVYGNAMDAQPTAFAAADYAERGPAGGLSPNGSTKYLDTGLQIAHLPTTRHHLSVYEVTKPSGSYRVRIGARENSGGANTHSIFNAVPSDTIGYWQNAVPVGTFIPYSESSALIVGASTAASNAVYKNASSNVATGSPTARTAFPTTPYYVFALNNGGSPSDHMNNGRLAAYSIGTFMGASAMSAVSNALQTFQTTLNRLSIGAGAEYSDVTNADALDWLQRVYQNGGTVSTATATAVNTFCNAIDAAGIRSKFLRLNPFAGNSDGALAAVRTPLYRGPSLAETQYGNEMDDNVNFVPADYSLTTGLTGHSSSGKYLRTGLPVSAIAGNNLHMGAGLLTSSPNTTTGSSLLGYGAIVGGSFLMADRGQGGLPYFQFGASQGAGPTSGNLSTGNYVASYPTAYQNGFPLANSASSFSNSGASSDFWVFNANGVSGSTSSRLGWYSIGTAFAAGTFLAPSTEISAFTSAMAALQTSLGRSAS